MNEIQEVLGKIRSIMSQSSDGKTYVSGEVDEKVILNMGIEDLKNYKPKDKEIAKLKEEIRN